MVCWSYILTHPHMGLPEISLPQNSVVLIIFTRGVPHRQTQHTNCIYIYIHIIYNILLIESYPIIYSHLIPIIYFYYMLSYYILFSLYYIYIYVFIISTCISLSYIPRTYFRKYWFDPSPHSSWSLKAPIPSSPVPTPRWAVCAPGWAFHRSVWTP